jgi:hypothetical protein
VKYLGKCTGKQEETELDVAKLEEYWIKSHLLKWLTEEN